MLPGRRLSHAASRLSTLSIKLLGLAFAASRLTNRLWKRIALLAHGTPERACLDRCQPAPAAANIANVPCRLAHHQPMIWHVACHHRARPDHRKATDHASPATTRGAQPTRPSVRGRVRDERLEQALPFGALPGVHHTRPSPHLLVSRVRQETTSSPARMPRRPEAARKSVRTAFAVRPPLPITRPTSPGATRSS